ncbi:MAG: type II toxin-antitoxin system HicA family toxin [Bauldia sp.]|nr:type II toxin-antitoxin system HicA family toxin [Bauldia sp.]
MRPYRRIEESDVPKVETSWARIIARLIREGWELVRHGGEHDIYRRPGRPGTIAVPRHRELSQGVARSIAKAAGWR